MQSVKGWIVASVLVSKEVEEERKLHISIYHFQYLFLQKPAAVLNVEKPKAESRSR